MAFSLLPTVTRPLKAFIRRRRATPSFSYKLNHQLNNANAINIIYILHAYEHKAGGDKIIYQQAQIINQQFIGQVNGRILHPQNLNFEHRWFEHEVEFKKDLNLNPLQDFVVIPEIWAAPHAKMLHKLGIKYAIFVQNGYSIHIPQCLYPAEDIQFAYEKAAIILSISDDTSACISLIFPKCAPKIQRIYYSVDPNKFKPAPNKENLITYMPRKLAKHSGLVMSFIQNRLPSNWRIQAIDGLTESGVIALLNKSKIFLSFSEFEGCPLPPVEAALTGNYVIGYTGEGAKEYWQAPIFTEVATGDIRDYTEQILAKIGDLDSHKNELETSAIQALSLRYSSSNENKSLAIFVKKVQQLLAT